MANTYQWAVNSMQVYPESQGKTDMVFNVNWVCSATDGINNTATYGSTEIPYVPEDPWIDYPNLTLEHVLGWVNEEIGADGIAAAQKACDDQLAAMATPTSVSPPLPWGTA